MNDYDLADRDWVSRQAAIDVMCELMHHWFGGDPKDEIREIKRELEKLPSAQTEQCKDAVSKAKVLETYADLYDVFDDNKEIQNELHKVFDRINNLPPAQTEHNADDERKIADLHKMVNYLLSRLEQPWIPVSEGLPKEYGEYICTMENGQVQECGFVPENQRGLVDGWSTCEADGHKFLGYADVLAWMPLPEPYQEGEADGWLNQQSRSD